VGIKNWRRGDRPREKLLRDGVGVLTDTELLAVLLSSGSAKRSVIKLARDLLDQFSGLRPLLNAELGEFDDIHGIGPAKYCCLQACRELGRRFLQETIKPQAAIHTSEQVINFLTVSLRDMTQEVFAVIFLNTRHEIIRFEKLFYGTINMTFVHPREVVKRALALNASALICAHNHPSGNPEPSEADINITNQLKESLTFLDIRLLDHIIIGNAKTYSFAEHGL